jgi:hypothetical protein
MRYSKGIMWLDDCRIPFVDEVVGGGKKATSIFGGDAGYEHDGFTTNDTGGRFTPNLLVCDDMLNDGKVSVSEGGKTTRDTAHFGAGTFKMEGYGDKGSNSRYYDLDLWFDKMLERL